MIHGGLFIFLLPCSLGMKLDPNVTFQLMSPPPVNGWSIPSRLLLSGPLSGREQDSDVEQPPLCVQRRTRLLPHKTSWPRFPGLSCQWAMKGNYQTGNHQPSLTTLWTRQATTSPPSQPSEYAAQVVLQLCTKHPLSSHSEVNQKQLNTRRGGVLTISSSSLLTRVKPIIETI